MTILFNNYITALNHFQAGAYLRAGNPAYHAYRREVEELHLCLRAVFHEAVVCIFSAQTELVPLELPEVLSKIQRISAKCARNMGVPENYLGHFAGTYAEDFTIDPADELTAQKRSTYLAYLNMQNDPECEIYYQKKAHFHDIVDTMLRANSAFFISQVSHPHAYAKLRKWTPQVVEEQLEYMDCSGVDSI